MGTVPPRATKPHPQCPPLGVMVGGGQWTTHPQVSSAWPLWVKCRDPHMPTRRNPGSLGSHMGPPSAHPPAFRLWFSPPTLDLGTQSKRQIKRQTALGPLGSTHLGGKPLHFLSILSSSTSRPHPMNRGPNGLKVSVAEWWVGLASCHLAPQHQLAWACPSCLGQPPSLR